MASSSSSSSSSTSQFPRYDARVTRFVSDLFALDVIHWYLITYELVHAETEEFWVEVLRTITTPEMKALLDRGSPPTWDELGALPSAVGCQQLGTYFIMVDAEGAHRNHGYNGSATGVDRMMSMRVSEHLNPEHRARKRRAGQASFLYNLLDTKHPRRSGRAKQTGVFPGLENGSPAAIIEMRVACLMHETMLQSWLKTFSSDKPGSSRQLLLQMGPWADADVEWLDTNGSVPIKEQFYQPDKSIIIDPELRRKQALARWKELRERDDSKFNRATWREQISEPVAQMRLIGIDEGHIKEWRRNALRLRRVWLKMGTSRPPHPNLPLLPVRSPLPSTAPVPDLPDITAQMSPAVRGDFVRMEREYLGDYHWDRQQRQPLDVPMEEVLWF